jgi:hypothetical protein
MDFDSGFGIALGISIASDMRSFIDDGDVEA